METIIIKPKFKVGDRVIVTIDGTHDRCTIKSICECPTCLKSTNGERLYYMVEKDEAFWEHRLNLAYKPNEQMVFDW